ncbi:hypothetical protein [Rasiella sp. SM2506]|uniref:hypothetical protein n=1 Tax=Rasiella sp. SM2506 TaxID=3423914 RepID=UPI003D793F56
MEEPYKSSEKQTKSWIQEAGLEHPGNTFKMKILERIESKLVLEKATPLISKKGWVLIAVFIVLCSVLLYVFPIELSVWENKVPFKNLNWNFNTASFKISARTSYIFIFCLMFLVQISILKRFFNKNNA